MGNEVTPTDAVAGLMAFHKVKTESDLHGKLPVSLRTFQRWKTEGWPQPAESVLEVLRQSGLLRPAEASAAEVGTAETLLARLLESVEELLVSERTVLADLRDVRTRLALVEEARSGKQPATRAKPAPKKKASNQ